jgi:peroxiredoxin Q/BCP
MSSIVRSLLLLVVASPLAAQAAPQGAATPAVPAPAVGDPAPDFTLPWADASGPKAGPVTLSKLRGQVVVLAFYPADYSGGCTIEMTKFRNEYKTLFGDGVVVLPISKDSVSTHARWAKDSTFQFALASDTSGATATLYGSRGRGNYFARTVFIVGKDGKIAWSTMRFNVNAQQGYDDLKAAVDAAKR